jgi:hypothetical protein
MIIRETHEDPFNLVGGAYVHSTMDGEGILDSEDNSVKGGRFIILWPSLPDFEGTILAEFYIHFGTLAVSM